MATALAPDGSIPGNTKAGIEPPVKCKEKRGYGSKRWIWTWVNYPTNWMALLAPVFESCEGWIGGYEICPRTGSPHIQGYIEWKMKVRPIGYLGAPKQIHWGDENGKPCRGKRPECVAYCVKEGRGYEGTFRPPRPLPTIELWGWQEDAKKVFEGEVRQRKIYWYWSDSGSRGKSNFVRWLAMQGALVCDGKAADMKYLILKYKEKHGDYPLCVVFDIPRSMEHYLSYNGMEQISNGVFASTKYECDMVIAPYMHIFVMANFEPDLTNKDMSRDRFVVTNVDVKPGIEPWIDWKQEAEVFTEWTDEQLLDF